MGNGKKINYTNFVQRKEYNISAAEESESCIELRCNDNLKWNDVRCSYHLNHFLCECDSSLFKCDLGKELPKIDPTIRTPLYFAAERGVL